MLFIAAILALFSRTDLTPVVRENQPRLQPLSEHLWMWDLGNTEPTLVSDPDT